ncbi:MAG: hypothetical protein PHY47_19240 [Lachnospiraceae bacterium]|nr:hypothetical protein [Lachnospiraceae bacterium]
MYNIQRYPQTVTAFVGIDTTLFGKTYYSKSDKWWLRQGKRVAGRPLQDLAVSRQITAGGKGRDYGNTTKLLIYLQEQVL